MSDNASFECANPTCRRPTAGDWCPLCEPIFEPFHDGDGPRVSPERGEEN